MVASTLYKVRSRACGAAGLVCAVLALPPANARAEDTPLLAWDASYVADVSTVAEGPDKDTAALGYASLSADLSLEKAAGWRGARLFVHGIATMGDRPNDIAGTIQGIDNIEAPEHRAKIYELYLEQRVAGGAGTVRLGFSDLNAEFYATDSSALLMAPAFGIGSELAATGPNGPSIFPSTALMARVRYETASGTYVQAAVVNAEAGVIGDSSGIPPLFGKGALAIAELGSLHRGKIALGGWIYTEKQEDIRFLTPAGDPVPKQAFGFYALFDQLLAGNDDRGVNLFARVGLSDGATTPFTGGWQAGLLAHGVIKGRPDSQLSFGMNQAFLSHRYRDNAADAGIATRRQESALELTYADKLFAWLTVQPDVQYIWNADRLAGGDHALVFALRFKASAAGH